MKPFHSALGYAAGLALTPALDYVWHRWIAHGRGADPSRAAHLEHHRTAHEEGGPWAEIAENAPRVLGTSAVVALGLAPVIGPVASIPLAAGLATGYVAITLSHARMHQRAPRTPGEERFWRFHFHHHYADAKVNYGLTSTIFDRLLGTAHLPDEVALPASALPAWWRGEHAGFTVRGAAPRSDRPARS